MLSSVNFWRMKPHYRSEGSLQGSCSVFLGASYTIRAIFVSVFTRFSPITDDWVYYLYLLCLYKMKFVAYLGKSEQVKHT